MLKQSREVIPQCVNFSKIMLQNLLKEANMSVSLKILLPLRDPNTRIDRI